MGAWRRGLGGMHLTRLGTSEMGSKPAETRGEPLDWFSVNLIKGYGPFPLSMKGLLKVSKREDEIFRAFKIIFIYMKQFWRKIPEENVTQCTGTETHTSACKWGSLLSVQLCPIPLKTHVLLSYMSPLANVTVLLCRRAFQTTPPSLDCTRNQSHRPFRLLASWI